MKTVRPALLALALMPLGAAAQARAPDLEHGRRIVLHGTAAGAQPCAACHQEDGTGDETGAFPRLTGQGAFYLYKQLRDYADGRRASAVMVPEARRLNDIEMQDAAAYFAAAQGPFVPPRRPGDGERVQRGGVLSAVGAAERNLPACANCHGQAGRGMPPSFPYLAGQYGRYIRDQLAAFREGARRNDPLDVMRDIAGRMTEEDMAAVAAYFADAYPPQR